MKKRNKILLVLFLIFVLPILYLSYWGSQGRQINKAEHFFKHNQPSLEKSIVALESSLHKNLPENPDETYIELKKPAMLPRDIDTVNLVRANGEDLAYEMFLGAFGIVPSGSYYGIYYSINGKPCNLMEPQYPEHLKTLKNKNSDEIWTWQEPGGDNSFYTERIDPHWFVYRQTF